MLIVVPWVRPREYIQLHPGYKFYCYTLETHGTADCTMIQLANVSQRVGGQLAAAEALVVLATIHPRVWRIDTVAVPFIRPRIMVQRHLASLEKPEGGEVTVCRLCKHCGCMPNTLTRNS